MAGATVVRCSHPNCLGPAIYKVAAPWSDGRFSELKTYGFACVDHLADVLRSAEARWLDYEPVREETVQDIGVYRLNPEDADHPWVRDEDAEEDARP